MGGPSPDEEIAAVLASHREAMLDDVRTETDRWLVALVDAFERDRWGSYYCLFREPTTALRKLTEVGITALPHLVRLPEAPNLLGRLLEVVMEMALVVVAGERASREREIHSVQELLEVQADFLALTLHELRGPLGRLKGYLSMIEDGTFGEVPEAMRPAVSHLGTGLQQTEVLINGLADVARLEDGADVLRLRTCPVIELLTAVVGELQTEAAAKEIRVETQLTERTLTVTADRERLQIALTNLLNNAIKYAPQHSAVTVLAERQSEGVAISVIDQGPGIGPDEAQQVFEKHRRGQRAKKTTPGLGLGLYIVRRIVELHGGFVALDTTPGRGSRFTVILRR